MPDDFNKRHVSGPMKFLENDEQRAKAIDTAERLRIMFESAEWRLNVANIGQVAAEDHLRIVSMPHCPSNTAAQHPTLKTSQSAPPLGLVDEPLESIAGPSRSAHRSSASKNVSPSELPALARSTSSIPPVRHQAQSTPRERWVTTTLIPTTPLSPTPIGNAFAGGGFWEQLTPQTPVAPQTPESQTLAAIPSAPPSPIIPQDPEARAAYDIVKYEIDVLSRTVCASRLSSKSRMVDSEDVPVSLVTAKDRVKAAAFILENRQLDLPSTIDMKLVQKLRTLACEEANIIRQYPIDNIFEFAEPDLRPSVDGNTRDAFTIAKERCELLRMHCRRKNELLKVSDLAVQQAWATRLLEEAEEAEAAADDSSSAHSDEGYDYSNFLRSIKSEVSSSSDLASLAGRVSYTDLASLRSNETGAVPTTYTLSRETTLASHRSSTSPKKPPSPMKHSKGPGLPNSLAVQSRAPDKNLDWPLAPLVPSLSNSPSPKKRIFTKLNFRNPGTAELPIEEEDGGAAELTSPVLSPAEKAFRRNAAREEDLDNWAKEVKIMAEAAEARTKAEEEAKLQAEKTAPKLQPKKSRPLLRARKSLPHLRRKADTQPKADAMPKIDSPPKTDAKLKAELGTIAGPPSKSYKATDTAAGPPSQPQPAQSTLAQSWQRFNFPTLRKKRQAPHLSPDSDKSFKCVTASKIEQEAVDPKPKTSATNALPPTTTLSISPTRQPTSPPPPFSLPPPPPVLPGYRYGASSYLQGQAMPSNENEAVHPKVRRENEYFSSASFLQREKEREAWWAGEMNRMTGMESVRQDREEEMWLRELEKMEGEGGEGEEVKPYKGKGKGRDWSK
ncbi:hypothetical protein GQ44DRAFT_721377 [Phaeosphaeriaceae sp. PMI808]|nr:hypothetical protein GQ44DRAFT_721377 [Phaeosphaeriaceae sp. PMI808]